MTCRQLTVEEFLALTPAEKEKGFPNEEACTCCGGTGECATCTFMWFTDVELFYALQPAEQQALYEACTAAGGYGGPEARCRIEGIIRPAGGCATVQPPPPSNSNVWLNVSSPITYADGVTCCGGVCVKNMATQPYRYKIAVNGQYQESDDPTERLRIVQALPCEGSFAYYVDYPGINGDNPCTLKVTAEAAASLMTCKTMEFNYNVNFDNEGNPTGATLTSSTQVAGSNCGSEVWSGCSLTTAEILGMVDFSPPAITFTRL